VVNLIRFVLDFESSIRARDPRSPIYSPIPVAFVRIVAVIATANKETFLRVYDMHERVSFFVVVLASS